MKSRVMQHDLTKELINRRTSDGKWIQGCEHTSIILNHKIRKNIVAKCVESLSKIKNQFDTICCCGISGLLVSPYVAEKLDKNLLIIRKEQESRYSPFQYEGVIPSKFVILDDLICSGETVSCILNTIKEECPSAECVGIYCYLKNKCSYAQYPDSCYKQLGIKYL